MNEESKKALLLGAFCGGCVTAGLLFILMWRTMMTSPNAGALVDGAFRPYREDPSGHVIGGGGAVLLLAGAGALVWAWRRMGR